MATLNSLKVALRQSDNQMTPALGSPLSEEQYRDGFSILAKGSHLTVYKDFIVPQLCHLLVPLLHLRARFSILEIGPGPESVLTHLPEYLRARITKYTAYEPNKIFASSLETHLGSSVGTKPPFPSLDGPAILHQAPFDPYYENGSDLSASGHESEKFDLVLFCHSMYGMKEQNKCINKALGMLAGMPAIGMVVVFHRDGSLSLGGLACDQTASFPTGTVCVPDDNASLDCFASFVSGYSSHNFETIRLGRREVCRELGRRDVSHPDHLVFSSPEIMVTFKKSATALSKLKGKVPLLFGNREVKNREARLSKPSCVVRPSEIYHIQRCVKWALEHNVGLSVIGGGHSGHCMRSHVVAVDMADMNKINIIGANDTAESESSPCPLVIAEAGCTTGNIIKKTMEAGLTVPLGSRPSVGAGLWLQGGIGHLARVHGLTCDAIVGAVVVGVESGQIFCIGSVPSEHWPGGAIRPGNEADLLWAIQGAGTSVGIVAKVVLKTTKVRNYSVQNWVVPLPDKSTADVKLDQIGRLTGSNLPRNCSVDAYLYCDNDQLHLGVTSFESFISRGQEMPMLNLPNLDPILGQGSEIRIMNGVELFEAEMHMSLMHGGHDAGKTSSFKRCLFLKVLGSPEITSILVSALESRPTPFCYFHLLHGGGAIREVASNATAFGCRNWEYACVITGVWRRNDDDTQVARAAIDWVYQVANDLLQLDCGVYNADLGPDPRDAALVANAFGPNAERLVGIRHRADPHNVLAFTCPIPRSTKCNRQKVIFLVSGDSCAGKDYCAPIWASVLRAHRQKPLTARVVSISTATKMAYATATGADAARLLNDRPYKEQYRAAIGSFFQKQLEQRPRLLEEQFVDVIKDNLDVDVLFITGMRDKAPVASLSHLVPDTKLVDIHVRASEATKQARKGVDDNQTQGQEVSSLTELDYSPALVFDNEMAGSEACLLYTSDAADEMD